MASLSRKPISIGFVILWGILFSLPSILSADTPQTTAADFKLKSVEGETYVLKELLAKGPVLVNFWTVWCKPCQKELPEMDKLYQKYKDQGYTFIAIAEDDQRTQSKVRPTVRQRKYTFPVLIDPDQSVGNLYAVRSYPTSYLISSAGTIVFTSSGFRKGDELKIEKLIIEQLRLSKEATSGAASEADPKDGKS
ncbi:MAG: TlpA family protein disulfide reductase [Candidatus Eisenbacteria bacterium]|uniref:TlpA family protein disulfide reductase n=1 Tax=Eiseniibacteriota bacterium TaxID=2212470 RepID=A0A948RZP2_UNCEI|nr:TlpA family protein disulfide reductase [Candidatus Eisenbacteria bacterium]MBU1949466.1 TlpA family protein disulfide reductase [Candidatus Eisenbacteria bacterium]MBU2692142.1 TlpA family protein disulfide reductase [Candidatus Eisenbacteria bacterium]